MHLTAKPSRAWRARLAYANLWVVLLHLCFAGHGFASSLPGFAAAARDNIPDELAELNLPDNFRQHIRRRALLDQYSARVHTVETQIEPGVLRSLPRSRSSEQAIRLVRPETPEPVLRYRLALEKPVRPLRGFRAPILEDRNDLRPIILPNDRLTEKERRAAAVIREALASDGLLATLSQVLEILGPEEFVTNGAAGLRQVCDLGFPIDLLRYVRLTASPGIDSTNTISQIAERLRRGESAAGLKASLQAVPFAFAKTHPDFRVADETGQTEIRLVRVQIGSGYRNGIIRGGIVDVAGQLIAALPQADFVVTATDDYFENLRSLALNCWRLRRPDRLSLIREQGPVRAWAQDNGKAGALISSVGSSTAATIVPRYASQDEVNSPMFAGESFLMDGLHAAGHKIVHSPLLFQGGNLMAVQDPFRRQHLLLISETELYRNITLGLTRDQALEAFRQEFGMDKCVVLPAVSYHLDYDVTLREHNGQILAFVNDSGEAARLIVHRAIAAMEGGGLMSKNAGQEAREYLANEKMPDLLHSIADVCRPFLNEHKQPRDLWFVSLG